MSHLRRKDEKRTKDPSALRFALLIEIETLLEAVNTSAGINKLLLTGVERMALGANFHLDVLLGRLCLDHVAAVAGDGRLVQYGMDVLFHGDSPHFL